jgi:prevent-host-death family protein
MDVGVRELRQNLSIYLERIKLGETLRITERGKPVALLTPLNGEISRLDALIAAGRARPGAGGRLEDIEPYVLPADPHRSLTPASDALAEQREERLP